MQSVGAECVVMAGNLLRSCRVCRSVYFAWSRSSAKRLGERPVDREKLIEALQRSVRREGELKGNLLRTGVGRRGCVGGEWRRRQELTQAAVSDALEDVPSSRVVSHETELDGRSI